MRYVAFLFFLTQWLVRKFGARDSEVCPRDFATLGNRPTRTTFSLLLKLSNIFF